MKSFYFDPFPDGDISASMDTFLLLANSLKFNLVFDLIWIVLLPLAVIFIGSPPTVGIIIEPSKNMLDFSKFMSLFPKDSGFLKMFVKE